MKFIVNPEIFSKFDNPRIAVSILEGIDNTQNVPVLNEMHLEVGEHLRESISSEKLSQDPHIALWREAYRTFGAKAKEYPSSIEALCKRVLKGNDVTGINPLVDIYNYISIKYMLPLGGRRLR